MTYLISWVASAFSGFLTVVFLVVGWGAIPWELNRTTPYR